MLLVRPNNCVVGCVFWHNSCSKLIHYILICMNIHMMTSSNGNFFRVTGHLCGELFPTQRPVTRSFDVYYDLRLNKRLSKQSWGWWFETPSHPLWRHRNDNYISALTHDMLSKTCIQFAWFFSSILVRLSFLVTSWDLFKVPRNRFCVTGAHITVWKFLVHNSNSKKIRLIIIRNQIFNPYLFPAGRLEQCQPRPLTNSETIYLRIFQHVLNRTEF